MAEKVAMRMINKFAGRRKKESEGSLPAKTLSEVHGSQESDRRASSESKTGSKNRNGNEEGTVTDHAADEVATPSTRDLWLEALSKLSSAQKEILFPDGSHIELVSAGPLTERIDSVIKLTKEEYEKYCQSGWHTGKGDRSRETNIRIQAKKIILSTLQFKEIISQFIELDPSGCGSKVWGVVTTGLQLLQNDQDRIDAVFDSAAVMTWYLVQYVLIEKHYRGRQVDGEKELENHIVEVYVALLTYAAKTKEELGLGSLGRLAASVNTLEDQEIQQLQKAIEEADKKVRSLTPLLSQQIEDQNFNLLNEKAEQTLGTIDTLIKNQQAADMKEFLKGLPNDDLGRRHRELRRKVEFGSGESGHWFLTTQEYEAWRSKPNTFLWMTGLSGCGKSSLCSTIIHHLGELTGKTDDKVLLYWYFDSRESSTQDIFGMVSSLLHQLAHLTTRLPPAVRQLEKPTKTLELLCSVLEEVIKELDQEIYIVLDAIDECSKDEQGQGFTEFIRVVEKLSGAQLNKLHLLISSTRQGQIVSLLQNLSHPPVEMNIDMLVRADLDNYIDTVVGRTTTWKQDDKDHIKNALREDSQRNFLITSAMLDSLRHCYDRKAIDETLAANPNTIEDMYEEMLENIPDAVWERVRNIFFWLGTVHDDKYRTKEQIAAVPGVELSDPDVIDIICPRYLVQEIRSWPYYWREPFKEITCMRFSHASVKRFLSSSRLRDSSRPRVSRFFVDESKANDELAKSCIDYLLRMTEPELTETSFTEHPFLKYAGEHWVDHLRSANAEAQQKIFPRVLELFRMPATPPYIIWMRVRQLTSVKNDFYLLSSLVYPSPLEEAIAMRHSELAHALLEQCSLVDGQEGRLDRALQVAVRLGLRADKETVILLIAKGANVNTVPSGGDSEISPLFRALICSNFDMARLLLENGADPNCGVEGTYHSSALQETCHRGREDMVELLISAGADINAEGGLHGTALQAAVTRNWPQIVDRLLKEKAQVNTVSGVLGTAMQAAITGDYANIELRLISAGAILDNNADMTWLEAFNALQGQDNHNSTGWRLDARTTADFLTIPLLDLDRTWSLYGTPKQNMLGIVLTLLDVSSTNHNRDCICNGPPYVYKHRAPPKLAALLSRLYENKAEKTTHRGILYKGIFQAYIHLIWPLLVSHKERDYLLEKICIVLGIIAARAPDQRVVEHGDSEDYREARLSLVDLYKVAFVFLSCVGKYAMPYAMPTLKPGLQSAMRLMPEFDVPTLKKETEDLVQTFREKNEVFEVAMAQAREVVARKALIASITQKVQQDIKGALVETEDRLVARIEDVEARIAQRVTNALTDQISAEVKRQVQIELESRNGGV